MTMLKEIQQVEAQAIQLFSTQQVEQAIADMAMTIGNELNDLNPVILCVLNGGIVTVGKLLPHLQFPLTLDAINVSRYGAQTSGTELQWISKPRTDLCGRCVLIVDDILDQGLTLQAIINYCQQQGASAVYSAVLVDKCLAQTKPVVADFVGLEVEDRYIYGYGMDYKGYLRNAAGIFACQN